MTAKGTAEIEKFLASAFRTRLKAATLKTMDVTVRFIRRDVAVVHVTSQISGFLTPAAQPSRRIAKSASEYSRRKMEFGGSARFTTPVAATLNRARPRALFRQRRPAFQCVGRCPVARSRAETRIVVRSIRKFPYLKVRIQRVCNTKLGSG